VAVVIMVRQLDLKLDTWLKQKQLKLFAVFLIYVFIEIFATSSVPVCLSILNLNLFMATCPVGKITKFCLML